MVEFLQLGLGNHCLADMKGLGIFLLERGGDPLLPGEYFPQ